MHFTFVDLLRNQFAKLGPFWWMAWNAMLALIPVLLAIVFFNRANQPRSAIRTYTFAFEIILVLLFLPNAPYVATDLVHFLETVRLTDSSLWKLLGTEFPLYVGFVLLGLVSYSFTTDRLLYALSQRLGKFWFWIGLFGIPLISSIGIYLGRVARFNSWDILTDPYGILQSSTQAILGWKVIKVILAIWLLLIIVHQVYRLIHDGIRLRLGHFRTQSQTASESHPTIDRRQNKASELQNR